MFRIDKRSRVSRAVIATLAGPLLVALAACNPLATPAEPARNAGAVGVVDSVEAVTTRVSDVHLTNGQTIRLDYDETRELYGSGPNPGDLLIYGDQPSPWRASLDRYRHGPGYEVFSQPDDDADGWITLDFGVRLPLAEGYDDDGLGQLEVGAPVIYVVNEEGEVIARP